MLLLASALVATGMSRSTKARRVDAAIRHDLGLHELRLNGLQFLCIPKSLATLRVAMQAPDVVRMLRWPHQSVVQAKVGAIGCRGLGYMALL